MLLSLITLPPATRAAAADTSCFSCCDAPLPMLPDIATPYATSRLLLFITLLPHAICFDADARRHAASTMLLDDI